MKNLSFLRLSVWFYLAIFFAYLLGPLVIMSVTAFNSPGFPQATPWECLTFEWFSALFQDERILNGIKNSILVGAGTVVLSVAMGLAGALMLTQIWPKLRATYYTVIIAPILIPGVVIGISTLVFWDRINRMVGLGADSFLSNGLFLTIIGQSTFIASYCMLVLVARLQRYDMALTEAALDLGATHAQAFRKVLLPFMKPAIASAAVLAFLASFENYNTTTFTFGEYPTLTIELAQKVRYGITPAISALAFIIVVLTVFAALFNEATIRRRELVAAARKDATVEELESGRLRLPGFLSSNWAALGLVGVACFTIVIVGTATVYSPAQCIADVKEQKRLETEVRIQELRQRRADEAARRAAEEAESGGSEAGGATSEPTTSGGNNSGFGGVFDPNALGGDAATSEGEDESSAPAPATGGNSAFGGAFDPNALSGGSTSDGN
ncbi:ABC transporter permease [Phaeobacter inhibens]|uniref:ABC-type spermidine/putrescine transport system, permease component II n=1 Tax=Phaeobacter inhibens TaxID=221822 RepID=A0ABN5GT07_9RHOB|nr:ABC transporter permease [Phaeobacter inhibens]AFO86165.1 ABC transporter permease protein [Phaeobacter inhibens 2.10]AFO92775.1 ABC transporter permease protein [Phaeobacter inhibens DSM 17395]AUQ47481.1 ABC-type spermidine/putrescine transport system, permease component II [Phaeobacter inhibens]AUQ51425.1 ABC-type spermidine/putrescine transport system, permease component II [Phaeobacter inhibens]AUQ52858.1 ABC-type spermidine/putrescine transport system, permease component II [Phaeobacte